MPGMQQQLPAIRCQGQQPPVAVRVPGTRTNSPWSASTTTAATESRSGITAIASTAPPASRSRKLLTSGTSSGLTTTPPALAHQARGRLPLSLDTYGSPGPVVGLAYPPDLYTATVPVNWWTAIGVAGGFSDVGGYSYDYGLTVQPPTGPAATAGPVELGGQDVANVDVVAVNTHHPRNCPQLAG